MSAVIVTCIVRVLETLNACAYMLFPKSPAARANLANKIVLGCIIATRKRWSSIPSHVESFAVSVTHYNESQRPLTILLQSCSSVVASSLINLFELGDRPPLRLLVLESRPKFEGVTFAKRLRDHFNTIPSCPPVTIEIATDSSVAYLAKLADIYLLAADRIYPNGDVSNKIGCLSAALAMKYHGGKKVVVVSTTDKISARDERCTSFEENEGIEVSAAWKEKVDKGENDETAKIAVRNVYFETVPNDLIDVYVTEVGVVDLGEIADKSEEHRLREAAAFEGIF